MSGRSELRPPSLELTRRGLLAGASALVLMAQIPGPQEPRPDQRGRKPASSGGQTYTFVNTAGRRSPSDLPLQATMWFVMGDVPAGSIAVPQVGGADLVYQADNRVYWGDGSLRGAVFRIARTGAIAAGGSLQIAFAVRSGSYSSSSAITTATITGETDLTVNLSNCHTASPQFTDGVQFAVTIGGGQVTGVKVYYPSSLTVGTRAVNQTGASGGQISVTSGTPAIVNPGSGYSFVGGSGTFSASLNTIISGINSSGNRTGGRRIEQYAKGPVCDAWRASTTISGLNHFHVTFYVERWKKADGSLLAYRRYAVFGTGLVSVGTEITNYTYDLDFKDGATIIAGVSGGDTRFQTMLNYVGSSGATFDSLGKPHWSANGTEHNAIVPEPTQAECLYLRKAGVMLPYLKVVPTVSVPTVPGYAELGANGGRDRLLTYQPFANGGIRSSLGSGGGGNQIAAMTELDGLRWLTLYHGQTANARVWLRNIRMSAAHSMSLAQQGSAVFEPTTMLLPCSVPTSAASFTGMTPTRENISAHPTYFPNTDYAHPLIWPAGGFYDSCFDTYHQICCTYGAYLIEGEQWQSDALLYSAVVPIFGRPVGYKKIRLGATNYYGVYAGTVTNSRVQAWASRSGLYAAAVRPAAWADGTSDPEAAYITYCMTRHYQYFNASRSFIGTVELGIDSGTTWTKSYDCTGTGVWPEVGWPGEPEVLVKFMEGYDFQVACHGAWLHRSTALGTEVATHRDEQGYQNVGIWAAPGSHHQVTAYRIRNQDGPAPAPPLDMASGFSVVTPTVAGIPQGLNTGSTVLITTTAGSSTVTLNDPVGVRYSPPTAMATGSRIILTTSDMGGIFTNAGPIPGGFNTSTKYYWLRGVNDMTGKLCTGLDGDGAPDPATAVVATTNTSGVYFWVVFSNPSPDSGSAVDNSPESHFSQHVGEVRLAKAFGAPSYGGRMATALTNLNTIITGRGGIDYPSNMTHGWDDNLL